MEKVSFKEFLQALMKLAIKIIIGLFVVVVIIGLIFYFLNLSIPNPPKPKIKYGEFPFEVTYEINGEVKTVQDVLVCKYDGIKTDGAGKRRKWKEYLKSNKNESGVFVTKDERRAIYIWVGDAGYYMDEEVRTSVSEPPYIYSISNRKDDYDPINEEEIKEQYKIKILDYKFSNPIENSFE